MVISLGIDSVGQSCQGKAIINDMYEADRVFRVAKSLGSIPLKFPCSIPLSEICLGAFADAAWANRADGSSQGGRVIVCARKSFWESNHE